MELKLNIYDELDEVVKSYTRQSYSIRMRQLKQLIETFELEKLAELLTTKGTESNAKLIEIVSRFVMRSYGQVQELMKDVFPGLNDEEYLDTHVDEVVRVVINLGKYSIATIGLVGGGNSKN